MNRLVLLAIVLMLQAANAQTAPVSVPFVGCISDGQQGPTPAPKGNSKLVNIPSNIAKRLAYYQAEMGPGVLAPRGWTCFGTVGSNGGSIFVSPQQLTSAMFFSDHKNWKGFTGPAIQLSDMVGDTSGRFSVAQTIARVFPAHRRFVRKVIKEDYQPAKNFPFGPYPRDKLTYRSKEIVEYETPPETRGLGTDSWLLKNASPIRGVAVLSGADPDCLHLSTRLPPDQNDLISAIVQQVEFDATHDN